MTSSVTAALRREHAELLRLLRGCVQPDGAVELLQFDEFRRLAVRHIVIEERLLLPALRARLGRVPEFQNGLRKDHAAIVALCVPTPDLEWLRDLADLLAYHQSLEEGDGGLFQLFEQLVGDDAEVAAAIERLPAIELPPFQSGPSVGSRLREVLREVGVLDP